MKAIKLTRDWNADPNAPEVKLSINGNEAVLDFFVNYFKYEKFKEGDKAKIIFENCYKYSFNSMNDEGYYLGQYRYKYVDLPWGEFYEIGIMSENDFSENYITISSFFDKEKLKHYIFFFRDNAFECLAESYSLEFYSHNEVCNH